MPSAAELRGLYRSFQRAGKKFPSYNIREYVLRRSREGFQTVAEEGVSADVLFKRGQDELVVLRRQLTVYGLYNRTIKNVMELDLELKPKVSS